MQLIHFSMIYCYCSGKQLSFSFSSAIFSKLLTCFFTFIIYLPVMSWRRFSCLRTCLSHLCFLCQITFMMLLVSFTLTNTHLLCPTDCAGKQHTVIMFCVIICLIGSLQVPTVVATKFGRFNVCSFLNA